MPKMTDKQKTAAREDLEQQVSDLDEKIEAVQNVLQDFTEDEVAGYLDDMERLLADLEQHAKDQEYTEFSKLLKPMQAQMKVIDKFCGKEQTRLEKETAALEKAKVKLETKLEKLNG